MERHEEALADFNHAIGLDPQDAWAIAHRDQANRLMGCHNDATGRHDNTVLPGTRQARTPPEPATSTPPRCPSASGPPAPITPTP